MPRRSVAIVGAGVSGLTCGVLLAESKLRTAIFAKQTGEQTTSAAAGAIWFPYDAGPAGKVIPWAMETYKVLVDLRRDPSSGVSMIELRQFSRKGEIEIPDWANSLGASSVGEADSFPYNYFALSVPLMDTTIYLNYLANRFRSAGGEIHSNVCFEKIEDVDPKFKVVINCAGIGARELVHDAELEPHRGQVAIVPRIDNLHYAIACDEPPLTYSIPRRNDCVLGGTNELSDNLEVDPTSTARIVAECSNILNLAEPQILGARVGLRPFRRTGVRVEMDRLHDGRPVIHNYGHGGSGFTLSWGCAKTVLELAS